MRHIKRRWAVQDRYGNEIYLSEERWKHIIAPTNHPEMAEFEEHLKRTIKFGKRRQEPLNPRKFRYYMAFDDLCEDNTHIVAIVLFRFTVDDAGQTQPNNYVVTAFQKEIG